MNRLTLGMNLLDCLMALSDGNPGAASALVELTKATVYVDPDNALGAFGPLLQLDMLGIYGPNIWILYKDNCQHDAVKMLAVLRANQLGFISQAQLLYAITGGPTGDDAPLSSTEVDVLTEKVMERLPNFNKQKQGA